MNRAMPVVFFAATIMLATSAPRAQTIDGAAYFTPLTDNVQPLIHGNLFSKSYLERRAGKDKGNGHARRATTTAADAIGDGDGDLAVRFDASISRAVRDDYIASIERSSGAKAARSLGSYYEANDVHALLRKAVAPYGLRVDDLGDVTTAWLVVMWMTANQASLPAVEVVQGVRAQTRAALLEGGRVPVRAAERQRALEALAYQAVTLIRVRESAQESGNETFLAELADSAQASMRRQDLDLRAMALTEAGMVRR